MNALKLVCLLVGFIASGVSAQQCDANEVRTTGDDRCYNHCDELVGTDYCRKFKQPTPGCYCKVGFCRTPGANNSGKCVAIPTCDANEALTNGDDRCYNHCNELNDPNACRKYSTATLGCYCKEGFCRTGGDDNSGECIPIVDPATCVPDQNEIYSTGDDRCYNHCNELNDPNVCRKYSSATPGCYCKEGFCRTGGDDNSGECIPIVDPATCVPDENEIYSTGDDRCYNHCNELNDLNVCRKYSRATPGCYCKEGFCRTGGDDNSGECIPIVDPASCVPDENEIYSTGDDRCYNHCNELNNPNICRKYSRATPGCYCKEGFCRTGGDDNSGECIPIPSETPEPVEVQTPEPVEVQTPEPIEIQTPEPVEAETPEPIEIQTPEPIEIETPEPIEVQTPEPVEAQTPEPIAIQTPEPVEVETPEPVEIQTPEPIEVVTPEPIEVETPEPVEVETPEPVEAQTPEPIEPEIPSCQGAFETYTIGINPCGNTCFNYKKWCNIATFAPVRGCDCISGYARIFDEGPCIPITDNRCQIQWSSSTTKPTTHPCSGGLLGGLNLGAITGTVETLVNQVLTTILDVTVNLTNSLTSIGGCSNTEIIGVLSGELSEVLDIIGSLNGPVSLLQVEVIFDIFFSVVSKLTRVLGVDAVSVLTNALEDVASSLSRTISTIAGKPIKQVRATIDAAVTSVAKSISILAHLVTTISSVAVKAVHNLVDETICTLVLLLDTVLLVADTVITLAVASVDVSVKVVQTVVVAIEKSVTEVTKIVGSISTVLSSTSNTVGKLTVVVKETVQSLVSVTAKLTGSLQIVTNLVGNLSSLVCNVNQITTSITASVGSLLNTVTSTVTGLFGKLGGILGGLFGRSCRD